MKRGFIILFFLICLLPCVQMLMDLPDAPAVAEHLSPLPDAEFADTPFVWLKQSNIWFQDHFGYRSFFIRLKEQIDYDLFHTSSRVYVGKDGQLFYRSVVDIEQPEIQEALRLHEDQILRNVGRLADALAKRGVTLIVTFNLMSNRFIPEKLPGSVPHPLGEPRIHHFLQRLRQIQNVDYFDTTAILQDMPKDQSLFPKTDFHWTDFAAATAGRELIRVLAEKENRAPPQWQPLQKAVTPNYSGGIADAMPLLLGNLREEKIGILPDIPAPDGASETRDDDTINYVFHTKTYNPTLLKPMFLLGDSFSFGLLSEGIAHLFNGFYIMRLGPNTLINQAMVVFPPDAKYFMIQAIEVQKGFFNSFTNDDEVTRAIETFNQRPLTR